MSPTKQTSAANATRAGQAQADTDKKNMSAQKKAAADKPKKTDPLLTKKIRVVADKNPKREKSASHARFALYASGQTVESYIVRCVEKGQLRRAARADIDWDVKHKFIELTD